MVLLAAVGFVNAGLAGMAMLWSFNFVISLQFNVLFSTEAEAKFNSVERMLEYETLLTPEVDNELTYKDFKRGFISSSEGGDMHRSSDSEDSSSGGGRSRSRSRSNSDEVVAFGLGRSTSGTAARAPRSWPSRGEVHFNDVVLRYGEGLEPALKGVSFTVEAGTSVGIVGRTGAGKSTLATALFRLVQPLDRGAVCIDGVDVCDLGLVAVRGAPNGVSIIPQTPCLFSGTVRSNLDPFNTESDAAILAALKSVRLGELSLDDDVQEGGQNFSVGEAQILCLARAKLRQPKVLVLDEATASVDAETDMFIQGVVEQAFKGTTLLIIAHRLHSIIGADKVCVMDAGRVAEFETPEHLLSNPDSLFSQLVDSTGEANATELRGIVRTNADQAATAANVRQSINSDVANQLKDIVTWGEF